VNQLAGCCHHWLDSPPPAHAGFFFGFDPDPDGASPRSLRRQRENLCLRSRETLHVLLEAFACLVNQRLLGDF
jgi:hypothetical protein